MLDASAVGLAVFTLDYQRVGVIASVTPDHAVVAVNRRRRLRLRLDAVLDVGRERGAVVLICTEQGLRRYLVESD